jgi:TPR repeat protein
VKRFTKLLADKPDGKFKSVAQSSLGLLHENGAGVRKDMVEAAKWFKLAADDGYPYAQFRYARCAFSDRNLHSRMPLDPTHVRLKRTRV